MAADNKQANNRSIRAAPAVDTLQFSLTDKTVTFRADDPTLEITDLDTGKTCRFR